MTNTLYIDVREPDELNVCRIDGAINVPLSQFANRAKPLLAQFTDRKITLICKSGRRATMAKSMIDQFDLPFNIAPDVYQGGVEKWYAEGHPLAGQTPKSLPIMRQVMLVAGLLVATSSILGLFVGPQWMYIAAFVGFGLTFSGATGICMMAEMLQKLPWNKPK